MSNAAMDIDQLKELIADEGQYPARNGYRDPSAPSFIFFDDDRETDPDILWGREMALDFEEWNAARNHFDPDEIDAELEAFHERMDAKSKALWLIGWHKRRPKDNDHLHAVLAKLLPELDKHDMDDTYLRGLMQAVKAKAKFAPGPVAGTVFVNPDGSRHETQGRSPGTAKASYIKRQGIKEEFASIDRVQKEGERFSRYVVGIRRSSAETPSNYYDPNPVFTERKDGREWTRAYSPGGRSLIRIPESLTFDGHRLTVREFEQALIAGAECFDNEDEAFVGSIERDPIVDIRSRTINTGYGCETRDEAALSHEEAYLYSILRMFDLPLAQEMMLLGKQEVGLIHNFFLSTGNYSEELIGILRYVAEDDSRRRSEALKASQAALALADTPKARQRALRLAEDYESFLPYVKSILLSQKGEGETLEIE